MWLLLSALAWGCEPTTNAQLSSEVQAAQLSYAVMDDEAFVASVDRAAAMVPCLTETVAPSVVAGLHRVQGMRSLMNGDEPQGTLFFAAARSIEPEYVLAETLAPEGGKLATAYSAAGGMAPLPRAPLDLGEASSWVDGAAATTRPEGPFVLQLGQGPPTVSLFVPQGQADALLAPYREDSGGTSATPPAPAPFITAPMPSAAPAPVPVATASPPKKGKGLLWAGVISGGAAAGLYGTAVAGRMSYDANPTSGSASLTNGAYWGSVGTATLSAGLLTTFLLTR